jgi:hypothetical protein
MLVPRVAPPCDGMHGEWAVRAYGYSEGVRRRKPQPPRNKYPRGRVFKIILGLLPREKAITETAMNMHVDLRGFTPSKPKKAHFLLRLLTLLRDVLSAPSGDQGGWEAGARGL